MVFGLPDAPESVNAPLQSMSGAEGGCLRPIFTSDSGPSNKGWTFANNPVLWSTLNLCFFAKGLMLWLLCFVGLLFIICLGGGWKNLRKFRGGLKKTYKIPISINKHHHVFLKTSNLSQDNRGTFNDALKDCAHGTFLWRTTFAGIGRFIATNKLTSQAWENRNRNGRGSNARKIEVKFSHWKYWKTPQNGNWHVPLFFGKNDWNTYFRWSIPMDTIQGYEPIFHEESGSEICFQDSDSPHTKCLAMFSEKNLFTCAQEVK